MRTVVVTILLAAGVAHADHHHGMAMPEGEDAPSITTSVAVVVASFDPSQTDNMFYGGSYEGVQVGGDWTSGRFSVGAGGSYYRMFRNGIEAYGLGDVMVHGQVTLVDHGGLRAGVVAMVSMPTGDELTGIGMGHVMAMPALWGAWQVRPITLTASAGYSSALFAPAGHVHGMAPLVDPMNMYEVSWSAGGEIQLPEHLRAGLHVFGGVPVGSQSGTDRLVVGGRVAWRHGRSDTSAELQQGLLGDPFSTRVVVSTALDF